MAAPLAPAVMATMLETAENVGSSKPVANTLLKPAAVWGIEIPSDVRIAAQ